MTLAVAGLALVALVAVVWLLLRHHQGLERAWAAEQEALLAHHIELEEAWTVERRELLNRIQRPHFMPLPAAEPFVTPEPEPDDIGLVGTIAHVEE